jgi:vacuolar-type H+-ATPase subunit H
VAQEAPPLVPRLDPATTSMNEQPKTPPADNDESAETPSPGPLAQSAAERLAVIIDAVERAAAGVIDDAEAEAKRHLEEARQRADRVAAERIRSITELTDGLIEQAEEVKRQAERLIDAFDDANAGLEPVRGEDPSAAPGVASDLPADPKNGGAAAPPDAGGDQPRPQLARLKPVAAPKSNPSRPQPPRSVGTRLLVTQMAISGSSRMEIEARLRNELGVQDTTQVVDAILGPEE